jgi:hypothetical protein
MSTMASAAAPPVVSRRHGDDHRPGGGRVAMQADRFVRAGHYLTRKCPHLEIP